MKGSPKLPGYPRTITFKGPKKIVKTTSKKSGVK